MRSPAHATHAPATHARAYPGRPEQIRAVRADLRALLDGCVIADDIILAASELAANAALHSDSRHAGGQFTVRALVRPGSHVRIEIDDAGGPWTEPAARPDRPHGLDIIRALTADWGIRDTSTGRTAWIQLTWPRHMTGGETTTADTGPATYLPGLPPEPATGSAGSSPAQRHNTAPGGQQATHGGAALAAAERFLAETAESVHPDLLAPALLNYAARYRAQLAALVLGPC